MHHCPASRQQGTDPEEEEEKEEEEEEFSFYRHLFNLFLFYPPSHCDRAPLTYELSRRRPKNDVAESFHYFLPFFQCLKMSSFTTGPKTYYSCLATDAAAQTV
jgi:hypothetical protein